MKFVTKNKHSGVSLRDSGFTLVETLVAISILLMAVVAPMVFISSNIANIFSTKDKLIALYLAEDAIDFVKYKTATEFNRANPGWLDGVGGCTGGQSCIVDSSGDTIQVCSGSCPVMDYNSSTGVYGYGSGGAWVPSKFTRTVTIVDVADDPYPPAPVPQEVVITTRVSWMYKGVLRETVIFEHAFPWGI